MILIEILGGFNPKIFSNPKLIKFIHSTIKTIEDLFYTLKLSIKDELIKKKSKIAREHLRLLYSILYVIKKKDLVSILISTLFRIITYNMVINTDDKDDAFIPTGLLNLSINLGEKIVDLFIRIKYKEVSRNIKLKEFKDNLIKETSLNNTEFLVYIGGELIKIMKECELIEDKVVSIKSERNVSVLILTEEIIDLLGDGIINKAISIPMNLPMIVEPKDYKDILHLSDGGYLLNNEEIIHPLFTDNLLQNGKTIIFKSNKVLESINGIMKVPFKINTELLNYILNTPGFINKDIYPPFYDVKKRNKVQENTYSNVPEIYFPLMMDFRGRIYPRVTYLNYQGSELAKSLLLFAYPGSIKRNNIKAIEYLKSYGAACFGHGLDKNFLAFCLEAKRFDNFYYSCNSSVFSTYLPIQLDASCNGFQHLALLSDEVGLFEELNLSESDEPKDFYTFILNKVNTHLQAKLVKLEGEDKLCVIRLLNLSLKRSNLKQLIMTKPYNASLYSMTNYLADSLVYRGVGKFIHVNNERHLVLNSTLKKDELNTNDQNIIPDEYKEYLKYTNDQTKVTSVKTAKARLTPRVVKSKAKRSKIKGLNTIVENENMDNSSIKDSNIPLTSDKSSVSNTIPEKEEKEYIYSTSDSSDDLVTRLDLFYYVNEFNNILLNSFPHIKRLIEYLDLISNILSKEITLSIIDKSTIDRKKQRNALMPNLVHSLDSTSMLLLYYSLKHTKNNVNFYSVHDCFGVTADNVETLIDLIKKVYINIYSDNKYIEKFDEDVIKIILIYYGGSSGLVTYDKDSRKISFKDGRDAINLPKVPLNTDMNINIIKDYYKKLSKSKLLIN
ncbi:putative DNA-directed RNA polymerase [Golovinomyces cichoracearum]|uniref:DNA-directed RNA polymerase n=1 Tax=Golovinomyces cichoracearum TaxID=62708 RepID=A0A420HUD9_9PEZI|nr:putative DNA-directed RNA polymerase [Golovinomyces cichoracearum]